MLLVNKHNFFQVGLQRFVRLHLILNFSMQIWDVNQCTCLRFFSHLLPFPRASWDFFIIFIRLLHVCHWYNKKLRFQKVVLNISASNVYVFLSCLLMIPIYMIVLNFPNVQREAFPLLLVLRAHYKHEDFLGYLTLHKCPLCFLQWSWRRYEFIILHFISSCLFSKIYISDMTFMFNFCITRIVLYFLQLQ